MKKVERSFSNSVRMPYQDAIAVVLHCHDFHMEMSVKERNKKHFHQKQAQRLKNWIVDLKDYIHEKEDAL